MGNINILNTNNNNNLLNNNDKPFYLFKDTINIEILYNNVNYCLKLSKTLNEDKIYLKIKEKPYHNKFIHSYFDNFYELKELIAINNYYKSSNTINNAFKHILDLINTNNFKLDINNNNSLLLTLYKKNESNNILEEFYLYKRIQTINEIKFSNNPNLIYRTQLINIDVIYGCNDIFEVYYSYKENYFCLVSPNFNNNNIDILMVNSEKNNNKLIKELKGHKIYIISVRYFLNKNNLNEYLISSDYSYKVIIWDLTDNYNLKYIIKTGYTENIYSCLILFNINNQNIIITSTTDISINDDNSSKIYSLDSNCKFLSNIIETNQNNSLYLLFWYNIYNSNNYLIECCVGKITVINITNNKLYCKFITDTGYESYCCGFIYKKNNDDFLIATSDDDYLRIWNLNKKILFNKINAMYCGISYLIRWSDDYFIVADQENHSFKIIDLPQLKIINEYKIDYRDKKQNIICIKKLYHPKYGESLLTCGSNNGINLWSIKQ